MKLSYGKKLNNHLTAESRRFEQNFGITRIARCVEDNLANPDELLDFSYENQQIIRSTSWLYRDGKEASYPEFLDRCWESSLQYVASGEYSCKYHAGLIEEPFSVLHSRMIDSENLRGRDGKSSRIGLDPLLKKNITELDTMTAEFCTKDEQDLLVTVMEDNHFTAEHEQQRGFFHHNRLIAGQLNLANIDSVNEQTRGMTATLLREHSKYSLADFNSKAKRFRRTLTRDHIDGIQQNLARDFAEKIALKARVLDALGPDNSQKADRFREVLDQINTLNYLNLNIEPKFSFKGWPGLFHHFVYRQAKQLSSKPDIYERQRDLYSMVTS